ncbi:AMP-binding protein [Pseudogracilibacillus auburnensis]|uniref:AMP-binding protein n=1 Tax=Pseudogracilibacillus auburnensis TaxID=1494959 RepID=UPI001A972CAB|nr:AMP-binding protein [Pseudogracilibacillus auburnensis]MBO1001739.1 AMP-binding protein [Pseudogracilibacillus auburnensis]
MTIGNQLETFAKEQPDKVAIYYQDKTISYDDFYAKVQQYKAALLKKTTTYEPQKIALLIGNEPAFLEVYFAVITLGWIAIPFDSKWSEREATRIMEMADPHMIVASSSFTKLANYHFPVTLFTEERSDAKVLEIENEAKDRAFYLGFTSGSTGNPKGFIRSHTSWLASFTAGEDAFHYGKNDIIMAPGPLCHSLSLFGATHALHIGASFYMTTSFSAREMIQLIQTEKATVVYAVPTMLSSLAKQKEVVESSVTFLSSGAKLYPSIKQALSNVFPNSSIYEYYGASELSYVTYTTREMSDKYPNSVGKPFPGVDILIRDENGVPLPPGEIGNIFIQSDFLFNGYVHDDTATKQVLTKYGATIGDLGFLNEEGLLTIIGRKNNMIISGGQNIYPEEVEKILKDVPNVKEAVIIGMEDEHWGQKVIALIEWKEKSPDNLKRLKAHCRKNVAIYKRPRKYYSVTGLPYTPTGKIARNKIIANLTGWIQ